MFLWLMATTTEAAAWAAILVVKLLVPHAQREARYDKTSFVLKLGFDLRK